MTERRWQPKATPIPEVWSITVADTWAADDTATITINEKDLVLTVGTDATTANVATAISEMINGDDQSGTGDHVFSLTGNLVGEFSNVTATVSGSVVTVTGGRLDTDGTQTHLRSRPFTLSAAEDTAGTGTATAAQVTAASGPHHVNDADNWSGGSVPVDSDDMVFDDGRVDCLYGLSALTAVSLASFTRRRSYTGRIGLPNENQDDTSKPYYEYLPQYLALGDVGDAVTTTFTLESDGGRTYIDNGDAQAIFNIRSDSRGPSGERNGIPAILIKGTHASNTVDVQSGSVGIAFIDGESAAVATLRVGYLSDRVGDSTVLCGDGVTLTTIVQTGGFLLIDSNVVTVTVHDQGTIQVGDRGAPTVTTLNLDGGTALYRGAGTLTTLNVGQNGIFDLRPGTKPVTITNTNLHSGSSYHDPQGRGTNTNGFDFVRCRTSDLAVFEHVRHITLTASAI